MRASAPWLCLCLFAVSAILGLTWGEGATNLWGIDIFHPEPIVATILWEIRLPRLLTSAACGALLAGAGVLSQGLFRNPLAEPSVLGTTSGATASVAFAHLIGVAFASWWVVPAFAVVGALASTLAILGLVSLRVFRSLDFLLLAGFAMTAMLSAFASLMISLTIHDYQKMQAMFYWLMGGFNGKGWEHLITLLPCLCLGSIGAWMIAPKLDVLMLGEEVSASLGIDLVSLRKSVVVLIALMVGGAIAAAGGISFVGLVIPHLTRVIFGPAHKKLFVWSMINGASLLMLADLAARAAIAPEELQVGVITAALGAPFFLFILIQKPKGSL